MLRPVKNLFHKIWALLAIIYFGYPARKLTVIGVTGTDGKTTTASIIYHLLKNLGRKTALITTVAAYIGDNKLDTGLHVTTPNPWKLQSLIKKAVKVECEYLVLEATSHGLDQNRVLGTNVSIAVLTNVTREHLDYHKTYERYLQAKAKLLKSADTVILNRQDKSYNKLIKILNKDKKTISYQKDSLSNNLTKVIKKKFPEEYNQLNATAAILAVQEIGLNNQDIADAIKTFSGVEGRMEEIANKKGIKIFVDFAHTPNALKKVLSVLSKRKGKNKLIAVFGCAGERDIRKRELMPNISVKLADISVFTAEDPRREDIKRILEVMAKSAKKAGGIEVYGQDYSCTDDESSNKTFFRIPERGKAISFAINKIAKKGDIVVVCGKGHEKSMSYNGTEYPWSDNKAIKSALKGEVNWLRRK